MVDGLSEAGIDSSVKKSLELLGVDQVNILYSHLPDPNVAIEESARGFDKHYRAGRFEEVNWISFPPVLWLTKECNSLDYAIIPSRN